MGIASACTSCTNESRKEVALALLAAEGAPIAERGTFSSRLLLPLRPPPLLLPALERGSERRALGARMSRPAARELGTCGATAASKAASSSSSRSAEATAQQLLRVLGPQRDICGGRSEERST